MPLVRSAQPLPVSIPGLSVTSYGTSTATPIGISRDTTIIYGSASSGNTSTATTLYQSSNAGSSWSTVATFSEAVVGLRETDDGEAIAITIGATSSPGYIYKSNGWSTSHTSATWTKTLTTIGGYIRPYWSAGHVWSFGDDTITAGTSKIGLASEYGVQTSPSGDQTTKARRVYLTQDYGNTWTQILDLYSRYPTTFPMHVHNASYDPYWSRIWVLFGDNGVSEGDTKYQILYSDDLGQTWTALSAQLPWQGITTYFLQSTSIAFLPDSIIIGNDNGPGYIRMQRKGYRKVGPFENLIILAGHTNSQMIATTAYQNRRQPGAPLLLSHLAVSTNVAPGIYGSMDGGQTIVRLWTDDSNAGNSNEVDQVFGPTNTGQIVATVKIGSTYNLLVGEIVDPGAGYKVGKMIVNGDGSTTSFVIAHGLGLVPTRYWVWGEKPTGTITTTVDASNLTVNFANTPANGISIPLQWRVGP